MTTPVWLDGYEGQTIEELIALEHTHRIDSLVVAFEQAIEQKAVREGDDSLTVEEQTVLAVEALENEVNDGGFEQFFVNSPEYAPTVVDALHRIGCPQIAAITEQALAALLLPAFSVEEIKQALHNDDDLRSEALDKCDQKFLDYPEPIAERLFDFIKENRDRIAL